ncbi:pretoxin HINT domain-containing protein [Murinocardiopsis flavida]|uniref:Pretoxin HINT domain-containing protein n=1 Tax=Murinocardiopsis flavida TaxID=645275 RepID=A0A2P8DF86_9ACTN|nr:polymorphic toxin-type HINT domain-containing protein [Murinocardiopsis flavida]PSK95875.1 pretoxin HINT domain-containing protein [Murinocardiopsis flavida]
MRWVWRAESGAGKIEYGALIVLAAVIVVGLLAVGLPTSVTQGTSRALCALFDGPECDEPRPRAGEGAPGGGGGGAPQSGPDALQGRQNPADQGGIADAQRDLGQAERDAAAAENDLNGIDEELIGIVEGLIGIEDIKKCFNEGDIGSCLMALVSVLPFSKIFKALSKIPRVISLFNRFRRASKAADDAKGKGDDARRRLDEALAACRKPNSFIPGTPVLMADGSRSPIEDVAPGDRVLAFDPATGEEGPRTVTGLIEGRGAKSLVDIGVTDGSGTTARLTATAQHPFWAPGSARWIDAADLAAGTRLRSASGEWPRVTAADRRTARDQRVHNLSVAGLHTYYVSPGGVDILVHNDECIPAGFDDEGEKYVRGKHVEGGPNVTSDKSVFGRDEDLDALVDKANDVELRGPNKDGNYERDVDAGRPIGRKSADNGGESTSRYRVVQDKYGAIITMHPL